MVLALGRPGLFELSCDPQFLLSREPCLLSARPLRRFRLIELFAHGCNVLLKLDHLSVVALNSRLEILLKLCRLRPILIGFGLGGSRLPTKLL